MLSLLARAVYLRSVSVDVAEVTENLRAMLRLNAKRFGLMVERQVQGALLPRVQGSRAALERPLWSLLVLLVAGHEAATPPLDDAAFETWTACASAGTDHSGQKRAAFPRAAAAVADALSQLREHGVLPTPRLTADEGIG